MKTRLKKQLYTEKSRLIEFRAVRLILNWEKLDRFKRI